MTLDRAKEIVSACMAHVWYREGIATELPPSLYHIPLAELLEANWMVAAAPAERTPGENGRTRTTIMMHCDDRLVAALYVAYHYDAQDPHDCEPVAYGPYSAVVVVKTPGWSL